MPSKALGIESVAGADRAKELFRRATARTSLKEENGALGDFHEVHRYRPPMRQT